MNEAAVFVESPPSATRADRADPRSRRFVEHHHDALYRFLRRLGVAEIDAEDAVQRVFLVYVRRRDAVDEAKAKSFLFGTALRVASDHRRSARRSSGVESADEAMLIDPTPAADDALIAQERLRQLDRVLESLPLDLRAVLVLVEIEEHSTFEVAEALGVPRGTVATRLRKARQMFEERAQALRGELEAGGVR